jgi:hypothetical protein
MASDRRDHGRIVGNPYLGIISGLPVIHPRPHSFRGLPEFDFDLFVRRYGVRALARSSSFAMTSPGQIEPGSRNFKICLPRQKSFRHGAQGEIFLLTRPRSGSFVLQGSGTYDKSSGIAKGIFIVVSGSGKGGLPGIRGEGSFVATQVPPASITLDYDIAETAGR